MSLRDLIATQSHEFGRTLYIGRLSITLWHKETASDLSGSADRDAGMDDLIESTQGACPLCSRGWREIEA